MTFFTHVGPSLLRVIYRSTGDCYTTEDHVSSSFTQLLLPNCMVQAEARPHEPLLSHHRAMMSRTSREQINRAAAILGLHQPWHAWNRGKYSSSPSGSYSFSPPSMMVPELWRGWSFTWSLHSLAFCPLVTTLPVLYLLSLFFAASGLFLP